MTGFGALILALVCLLAGRRRGTEKLPALEALWFHASLTWPVVVLAAAGSLIFATNSGASFTLVTYGPAILMSAILLVSRLLAKPRVYAPGLVMLAFPVLAAPSIFFGRGGPVEMLPLLFLLPAVLYPRAEVSLEAWARSAGIALFIIAASLLVVGYTTPANVLGICRLDKCSIFGEVLTSPITNNGNFAGISIALLLPVALIGLRRFPFILTAAGALILVELAGSRAAELSAFTLAAVFLLTGQKANRRVFFSRLVLAGGLTGSLITAFYPFEQTFATNRGYLWDRARELIAERPLLGWGPLYWGDQGDTTALIANYSPHNFWLELAVSTGFIGVVLIISTGILMFKKVPPASRYAIYLIVGGILLIGALESPLQPSLLGLAPFAHILPLMIAAGTRTAPPADPGRVEPMRLHQLSQRSRGVLLIPRA